MRRKLPLVVLVLAGAFLLLVITFGSFSRHRVSANPYPGLSAVAAGSEQTCALAAGGTEVKCWGFIYPGTTSYVPIDRPTGGATAVHISIGLSHGCGLITTGGVKCSGFNVYGQLGDGTNTNSELPVDVSGLTDATAIDIGPWHSCAVTATDALLCWGRSQFGQLGDGTITDSNVPLTTYTGGVQGAALGIIHSCALLTTDTVQCWGDNSAGQLGDGSFTSSLAPVDVDGLSDVTAIVAGDGHTCALLTTETVQCWGLNHIGQLGDGTGTYNDSSVPVDVDGLTDVASISAGGHHTCAVTNGGDLYCWGENDEGQLGSGTPASSDVPVAAAGITSAVAAVSAGVKHTCVETASGPIQCAGRNVAGQLGDGTTTSRSFFADVVIGAAKPTPTPTVTLTPTPSAPGLDFSIGIDPLGGSNDACTSSYGPYQACQLPLGKPFDVHFYLNSLPDALPGGDHQGYLASIGHTGAAGTGTPDFSPWPGCQSSGSSVSSELKFSCEGAASAYTGLMATVSYTCAGNGAWTLLHGFVDTALIENGNDRFYEGAGIGERLDVQCIPPLALPGDQDGDGCADVWENGDQEQFGGRRNFLNPHDFFDTDGSRTVDLFSDIFAVAAAFGAEADGTPPGYDSALDRSAAPPSAETWAMGPPDGTIDLFVDIFGVSLQFGHSCDWDS